MTRLNDGPDFDPRIADWLENDPVHAPAPVLATVLAALPSIPQRRASRVPWRFPPMNGFAKLAVAAVAVIAIGAVGLTVLQRDGPRAGGPVASPSPSPSPSPASSPASAPYPPPALTETFTSSIHGVSVSYPAGWATRAASEPWSTAGLPYFGEPTADVMYYEPLDDHYFLLLASQPLAAAAVERWQAALLAGEECGPTEPIAIDGHPGIIAGHCPVALVSTDGRGYAFLLYASDAPDSFDRVASLREVLATVRLHPEDAADVTAAPAAQRASGFRQTFSYTLPAAARFDHGPDYGPTYFEVRIPAAAQAGTPSGFIVQAIGGGRSDPCAETPDAQPIAAGPQAVIDYLGTIPGIRVTDASPTEVDGRPAVQATVVAEPTPGCPEIRPWAEGGSESFPDGAPMRLVAVDVGGEHIVLMVYGEDANPTWDAMADQLIGSIRFEAAR